jgi:hypothetical protein
MAERRRIVARLDEPFSEIDESEAALERARRARHRPRTLL